MDMQHHRIAGALEFSGAETCLRIRYCAAARQHHAQRAVVHSKGDFAKLDPLAGMDGLNSGAVQVLPELDDGRMSAPPVGNVLQDLDVRSIVVGIETAPSAKRTAVSESQIRGLADLSSGFILWRHRSPEHPRRDRTVGFQRRITGDVVATVILKYPHLGGRPPECSTFDRREVAADKQVLA